MSSPCVPVDVLAAPPDKLAGQDELESGIVVTPVDPKGLTDPLAWVDSDDPDSIRQYTSKMEEGPKSGVGCWRGCLRDVHCRHVVLYIGLFVYIAVWIAKRQTSTAQACIKGTVKYQSDCTIWTKYWAIAPLVVIYLLFLVEFLCSSTNQYLRHTETIPDALDFLDKLYRTKPTLSLSMECYHYETHTVKDSNGKTRTERRKVTTWRGSENVRIVQWQDVTARRLDSTRLAEFQLNKVKIDKAFTADENYRRQKEDFIRRNRHRDTHYNLFVHFGLKGFQPRLMTYVQFDSIPWLLGWDILLICHLLVLPALPYRIWLSSITGKVETVIHKKLQTGFS